MQPRSSVPVSRSIAIRNKASQRDAAGLILVLSLALFAETMVNHLFSILGWA